MNNSRPIQVPNSIWPSGRETKHLPGRAKREFRTICSYQCQSSVASYCILLPGKITWLEKKIIIFSRVCVKRGVNGNPNVLC